MIYNKIDKLPEEIQNLIYEYKHQLEFCDVVTHIEFQFVSFCPSCGQGISFCFGKRCKCPGEIRDNISVVSGLDIMIVRELTGGIYFGEPRGIEPMENNQRKGINTHTYTTSEIHRIARVAFDLAKKRKNKVKDRVKKTTNVDLIDIMKLLHTCIVKKVRTQTHLNTYRTS